MVDAHTQAMQNLRPLPIGIQDFAALREGGFLYVDKTQKIYPLVRQSKGSYFLSRPRRFGKSLLVSTLEHLFRGHRSLFTARDQNEQNLWIHDRWQWQDAYPVLRLDLSTVSALSSNELKQSLLRYLQREAEKLGISLDSNIISTSFSLLIEKMVEKFNKKIIILIDEYDKPILDNLYNPEVNQYRQIMRSFYQILKSQDHNIRFLLLTGISRFSKMSIFSALNNLEDISLDQPYAQILGITQTEIDKYFKPYLELISQQKSTALHELLAKIRYWYDGYSFDGIHQTYNPFSLLNYCQRGELRNYWIGTGSSQFLMDYLKHHEIDRLQFQDNLIDDDLISSFDIEDAPPEIFFLQAGYLTFSKKQGRMYELDYPNMEVESSLRGIRANSRSRLPSQILNN
jgi:hypothetical protein